MREVVSVNIRGLDALQARLETAPPKIARAILRRALRAGGQLFLDEMKNGARRATGFLQDHIAMRIGMSREELAGTAKVGPLRTNYPVRLLIGPLRQYARRGNGTTVTAADVGRFLEFGTRKMAARPFMRRVFESRKDAALDAFTSAARSGVEEGLH